MAGGSLGQSQAVTIVLGSRRQSAPRQLEFRHVSSEPPVLVNPKRICPTARGSRVHETARTRPRHRHRGHFAVPGVATQRHQDRSRREGFRDLGSHTPRPRPPSSATNSTSEPGQIAMKLICRPPAFSVELEKHHQLSIHDHVQCVRQKEGPNRRPPSAQNLRDNREHHQR